MAQTSSHMMKTTKRGRPFVKDTHDLFATLIVSLQLETHRQFFKSYPNSFTTDEAALNLSSLKFSQSNRTADPKDPTRIVTTTTTTTFSMTREMAKGICQHYMDARLIENAADLTSTVFKDRGVFMLTPKGLHILERFVTKNGITATHLMKVFQTQPIAMKILHLERRASDDEILINHSVIDLIWKRVVGRTPNLAKETAPDSNYAGTSASPGTVSRASDSNASTEDIDRNFGLPLKKIVERTMTASGKQQTEVIEYSFAAMTLVDWLCDFTTIVGRDEATDVAAQFVRYGLISLVHDKAKKSPNDNSVVAADNKSGTGAVVDNAKFHRSDRAIYQVTEEGARIARWGQHGGRASPTGDRPSEEAGEFRTVGGGSSDPKFARRNSQSERLLTNFLEDELKSTGINALKESHTSKLKQILEEPALRSLFREHLRANYCEENLSFWLDVQDFKRRFNTTSSAVAAPGKSGTRANGHAAMEKHQQDLITMAMVIYNSYLAPASPCELNIDHNLRAELVTYMGKVFNEPGQERAAAGGALDMSVPGSMHASQLQTMLRMYERITGYVFRLMATDSVPKFCKTERFLALMRTVQDYQTTAEDYDAQVDNFEAKAEKERVVAPVEPPSVDNEKSPSKAYLTISQAANEKQAANLKSAQMAPQNSQ